VENASLFGLAALMHFIVFTAVVSNLFLFYEPNTYQELPDRMI